MISELLQRLCDPSIFWDSKTIFADYKYNKLGQTQVSEPKKPKNDTSCRPLNKNSTPTII